MHECDVWHRTDLSELEWVCPDCGQTWAYLTTHNGTGWYRLGTPSPVTRPAGEGPP